MKEILNILIPFVVAIIIALILYCVIKHKPLAVMVAFVLMLISSGVLIAINMPEKVEETNMQKTEDEIWRLIEVNFTINKYEDMLKVAEENQLMEDEKMLNVLGVMYAQGIYYEQDYDKALAYLKAAAVSGKLESTFINLWLASYVADVEKAKGNDITYKNCMEALKIAENHKNNLMNEMLKTGIYVSFKERVEDGYSYLKGLSYNDKNKFLGIFCYEYKILKYIVVTDYLYLADTTNLSTGEVEYDNVVAIPHKLQELQVPVYLFVAGAPTEYKIFEDISLSPFSSQKPIVTGEFKYETSYLDENGKVCYWKNTDEIFYGDEPPEADENSRWMIMPYDGVNQVRRYVKQVKE